MSVTDSPAVSKSAASELLAAAQRLSEAEAWVPWKEPAQPRAIAGTVLAIGTAVSDYEENRTVPVVVIHDEASDQAYRVTGYATVLERELRQKTPAEGDLCAVTFDGEGKASSGMNPPRLFTIVVRHATPTATAEQPAGSDDVDDLPF